MKTALCKASCWLGFTVLITEEETFLCNSLVQWFFVLFSDANLSFPRRQTNHSKHMLEYQGKPPFRLVRVFSAVALLSCILWTDPNVSGMKFSLCPSWSVCGSKLQVSLSRYSGGIKGSFKTKLFPHLTLKVFSHKLQLQISAEV